MTFPSGSNHVPKKLHNALRWIIENYLLIPTCMICLLDQFQLYAHMIVFSPTGSCGLLIFVVYLEKVKGLPGPNCLKCVCMYVGLSCTY